MERRSFLKGALALAVTPVLRAVPAPLPAIYGDGLHDDTAGLQAMFDGMPFTVDNQSFVAFDGKIDGGAFRLTDTLIVRRNYFQICNCTLLAEHKEHVLVVDADHGRVDHIQIMYIGIGKSRGAAIFFT